MTKDIKQEWLEAQLKNAMRSISAKLPKGVSLENEEAEKKIFELYDKVQKSDINHNFDLNSLIYYLQQWLIEEKKIPEPLAAELCLPLHKLIMEIDSRRIESNLNREFRKSGDEAKVIPFPEKMK
jgi:hypothetical protein